MSTQNLSTQNLSTQQQNLSTQQSEEQLAPSASHTAQPAPPSRRAVVTATGVSALAAGLAVASAAPATALSPVTAPSTAPAKVPPPGIDRQAYRTVARAIAVYDEHDNSLVPGYLRAIENGLPAGRAKATKRVLVIGAGPAGLLAADLLNRAGHEVVVIEANGNRVGGRIKTFRKGGHENGEQPFADPRQYAEAGAMRLPDSHPLLMALIKKYDIARQEFYLVDVEVDNPDRKANRTWIHVNGIHMRRADYEKHPEKINDTFGVTGPNRTKTASAILTEALKPARRLVQDKEGTALVNGWITVLEKYGHWSMYRYLTEVAGLDTRTIDLIGTIQNLTSRLHLSFVHSFLSSVLIAPSTKFWELKGGTAVLADALYAPVKAKVRLDRRAVRIERVGGSNGGKVKVHTVSEDCQTGKGVPPRSSRVTRRSSPSPSPDCATWPSTRRSPTASAGLSRSCTTTPRPRCCWSSPSAGGSSPRSSGGRR